MKLYVMANGTAPDMPKESMVNSGAPVNPNDVVAIPIMTFLVEHPEGLILYDTGFSQPGRYPRSWPIADNEMLLSRLSKIGVQPRDIRYVVCSHLHIDHAGGPDTSPHQRLLSVTANLPTWPNFISSIRLLSLSPKTMLRPGSKQVCAGT